MAHDVLKDRIDAVRHRIRAACMRAARAEDVTLIAVTKTISAETAKAAFELGLESLAENRPQELWRKQAAIPGARWHLIGHLQRNKIERTASITTLIHSVDSLRLLESLESFGLKANLTIPILFEFNCSGELTKNGFRPEEAASLMPIIAELRQVEPVGLMTMAAPHEDPEACRPTFRQLRQLRDALREQTGRPWPYLSMGMSGDFEIAIEEGASHIRLGSVLFEGLS